MINEKEIKAIKKIIQKKNFTPDLGKLWYLKDENVRVASDSYILLEIKNDIEGLPYGFSIDILDLEKIKDMYGITIENGIANITQSKSDTLLKIGISDFKMRYKELKEKHDEEIKNILVNKNIARFFDLCNILGLSDVKGKDTNLYTNNEKYYLITQKIKNY